MSPSRSIITGSRKKPKCSRLDTLPCTVPHMHHQAIQNASEKGTGPEHEPTQATWKLGSNHKAAWALRCTAYGSSRPQASPCRHQLALTLRAVKPHWPNTARNLYRSACKAKSSIENKLTVAQVTLESTVALHTQPLGGLA